MNVPASAWKVYEKNRNNLVTSKYYTETFNMSSKKTVYFTYISINSQ